MSAERRQYRRIPMGATIGFQEITFQRETAPSQSVYLDVSAGGLLLQSPRELPLGALLKLEVRIPGWGRHLGTLGPATGSDVRPLIAIGQVVRVEALDAGQYELGVKFQNVYPDDWAALQKFIDASLSADEN